MLEMNQLSMNEGVWSLMDMYSGTTVHASSSASRQSVAAAAAHVVQSGAGAQAAAAAAAAANGGAGHPGGILRSSTLTRKSKAGIRSKVGGIQAGGGGADVPLSSVPWPVSTSKFSDLLGLDFNVWTYTPDDLLVFAYEMFVEMRLVDEFQIVPEILKNFFLTVRSNYFDNPFHNCQ